MKPVLPNKEIIEKEYRILEEEFKDPSFNKAQECNNIKYPRNFLINKKRRKKYGK